MRDEEAFLQAIIQTPDDDTPRLVFADFLEEKGNPRGEFIRVQCALAKAPAGQPRPAALEARERELLSAHAEGWLGEEWPQVSAEEVRFERGFVAEASLRGAALGDAGVRALAGHPWLGLLTALDLWDNDITAAGLLALARSPYLANLTFIDLRENRLGEEDGIVLDRFDRLLRLESLFGPAPVQAWGAIVRHTFYFRSRYRHWSFGLSEDRRVDASDVYQTTERGFALEGKYGESSYAASYMPEDEAVRVIRRCGEAYRKARSLR